MRFAFLLESRRAIARVTAETMQRLRERGAHVDVLFGPDSTRVVDLSALRPEYDVYVLKSKSPLTHSLAGAIEASGGCVVNSHASSVLTWDKVATTGVLAAAGIPVPMSWAAGTPQMLTTPLECGPLWFKPQHGKSGAGVRRVDEASALDEGSTPVLDAFGFQLPVFAQRDVPSAGTDFKVYAIGDRLWSLVKQWPPRGPDGKLGVRVDLPDSIAETALNVGFLLGLEVYGVDFLLPTDGSPPVVIDVNAFPGYNGLAEAPEVLATHLFDCARRQQQVRALA
jgi:ribosomal protein S6--L-glutamate ligase